MAIKKPFGYGSLSLVIILFGLLMNWHFGNGFVISHFLFNIIGLDIYSNGTNGFRYPFLAAIPFWLAAVMLSKRHVNDFGAAVSNWIGKLMLTISAIVTIIFLILPIWIKF